MDSVVHNVTEEKQDHTLQALLDEYDISITGKSVVLSHFQLDGLLHMIPVEEYEIIKKYTTLEENTSGEITLTAAQVFELIYYSYSSIERDSVLKNASHHTKATM